jgi:hypothetical protein
MLFYLIPIPHNSINIHNPKSLIDVIRDLHQHKLIPIESLPCLPEDEVDIGNIVDTDDILGIEGEDLLVDLLGGEIVLHLIEAHCHIF